MLFHHLCPGALDPSDRIVRDELIAHPRHDCPFLRGRQRPAQIGVPEGRAAGWGQSRSTASVWAVSSVPR